MNKTNMVYFGVDDVLHLAISDEPEAGSVEISPGITAEINAKGELIGIEILRASLFVRDTVIDSVQAKLLGLAAGVAASLKSPVPPKRARTGITGPRRLADKVAEPTTAYLKKTPVKSKYP